MVILQSKYTAKRLFLSLHGQDVMVMPNDAADGNYSIGWFLVHPAMLGRAAGLPIPLPLLVWL